MAEEQHQNTAHQPPQAPPPERLHLFDAEKYTPDTIDLSVDPEACQYWLNCFRELIGKFAAQAAADTGPDSAVRAEAYRLEYLEWLESLMSGAAAAEDNNDKSHTGPPEQPTSCVVLSSIRMLLERNEQLLLKHGFADPWREVKRAENQHAVGQLAARLGQLDALRSTDERHHWTELFRGLFAGNVFDWGAQAVTQIREQYDEHNDFGLREALDHIQPRPWLIDDMDRWLERIAVVQHRCAAVFVDNSGVDVVLGVLPFVRELLRGGTRVIMCANRRPSLNDITCAELGELLRECSDRSGDEHLREALNEGRLLAADNGQSGPCLDMRHISEELSNLISIHRVDLLIIEGMGRALHTNFSVPFYCDTLKLAVVKNAWWAKRLGGANFAVICKFEPRRD